MNSTYKRLKKYIDDVVSENIETSHLIFFVHTIDIADVEQILKQKNLSFVTKYFGYGYTEIEIDFGFTRKELLANIS